MPLKRPQKSVTTERSSPAAYAVPDWYSHCSDPPVTNKPWSYVSSLPDYVIHREFKADDHRGNSYEPRRGPFDFDMKSVWQRDAEDKENAEKKKVENAKKALFLLSAAGAQIQDVAEKPPRLSSYYSLLLIHMGAHDTARGVKSDYKGLRVRIRNYGLDSLTVSPAKIMDQGPLVHISGSKQEKEVIRKSQHGFTKGQSCPNNPIARYDKMTGFVDKGRAVDDFHLALSSCQPLSKHSSFS
ncbi:PREDICTED: uncharacterized protein LOC104018891 [Nipponia nippon]|uniref:uncharacterized protein LOC104018891 n=1 Tax=Nipponia nippon TaxID=128390 RepID=UPI0005114ABA|nr:PREDICTED: uncharacterized protein LOC104018891 [Nipponia nippon]